MKLIDIIKENLYHHNHNVNHFDHSDLTFNAVQVDEDHVDYYITIADSGRRIGKYTLWNCADTVFIWDSLNAPNKTYIYKLMGIIPAIILDYMANEYYPEDSYPDEFNIDLDTAIKSKRFNEWDYYYYTNNALLGNYRVSKNSVLFRINPPKKPKIPQGDD